MKNTLIIGLISAVVLAGCTAKGDDPGLEYAPNMYHSVAYEPLTQITDEDHLWPDSNPDDGVDAKGNPLDHGEFYNSNPYNPHKMNMLEPVEGTVRRGAYLPYRLGKDSVAMAATMESPLEVNEDVIAEGKALYERFCQHCHGEKGQGDGLVGQVLLGVPAYNAGATKDLPEGHIFHVITHGIRRMGAHGSQLSIEERWKIVSYVQTLQKQ